MNTILRRKESREEGQRETNEEIEIKREEEKCERKWKKVNQREEKDEDKKRR